jgi:hypothetical protein
LRNLRPLRRQLLESPSELHRCAQQFHFNQGFALRQDFPNHRLQPLTRQHVVSRVPALNGPSNSNRAGGSSQFAGLVQYSHANTRGAPHSTACSNVQSGSLIGSTPQPQIQRYLSSGSLHFWEMGNLFSKARLPDPPRPFPRCKFAKPGSSDYFIRKRVRNTQ